MGFYYGIAYPAHVERDMRHRCASAMHLCTEAPTLVLAGERMQTTADAMRRPSVKISGETWPTSQMKVAWDTLCEVDLQRSVIVIQGGKSSDVGMFGEGGPPLMGGVFWCSHCAPHWQHYKQAQTAYLAIVVCQKCGTNYPGSAVNYQPSRGIEGVI